MPASLFASGTSKSALCRSGLNFSPIGLNCSTPYFLNTPSSTRSVTCTPSCSASSRLRSLSASAGSSSGTAAEARSKLSGTSSNSLISGCGPNFLAVSISRVARMRTFSISASVRFRRSVSWSTWSCSLASVALASSMIFEASSVSADASAPGCCSEDPVCAPVPSSPSFAAASASAFAFFLSAASSCAPGFASPLAPRAPPPAAGDQDRGKPRAEATAAQPAYACCR
mmetsp:Transcript_8970/g.27211  ORF Transcript_8970/g.27211 Transcript_8970/m.27211 type:complete len:228 (-) Transcript_8970:309-992(-)